MKRNIYTLVLIILSQLVLGQNQIISENEKYTSGNKGKIVISWGGNRGYYTKSDIRFRGEGYDFTLHDVKAHDVPKGWHIDYVNPGRMTIPQTNAKSDIS